MYCTIVHYCVLMVYFYVILSNNKEMFNVKVISYYNVKTEDSFSAVRKGLCWFVTSFVHNSSELCVVWRQTCTWLKSIYHVFKNARRITEKGFHGNRGNGEITARITNIVFMVIKLIFVWEPFQKLGIRKTKLPPPPSCKKKAKSRQKNTTTNNRAKIYK